MPSYLRQQDDRANRVELQGSNRVRTGDDLARPAVPCDSRSDIEGVAFSDRVSVGGRDQRGTLRPLRSSARR